MAFVDFLAFVEVTLLIGAALVGYVGVLTYVAMRRNDPTGVKSALRGAAVPVGSVGAIALVLGLWGEIAWPLPGSYNILFFDAYVLFGATFLVVAISMGLSLKLQYGGFLSLLSGGVIIAYGWQGYVAGMTKDPFDTLLLYAAFGAAAIIAFPATVLTDYYLGHADGTSVPFGTSVSLARRAPSFRASARAAQPVVPASGGSSDDTAEFKPKFRLPYYVPITVIMFVVMMGLAAIAALFYLNLTIPAHLAYAP
jgi:putative membrane protein